MLTFLTCDGVPKVGVRFAAALPPLKREDNISILFMSTYLRAWLTA